MKKHWALKLSLLILTLLLTSPMNARTQRARSQAPAPLEVELRRFLDPEGVEVLTLDCRLDDAAGDCEIRKTRDDVVVDKVRVRKAEAKRWVQTFFKSTESQNEKRETSEAKARALSWRLALEGQLREGTFYREELIHPLQGERKKIHEALIEMESQLTFPLLNH